MLGPFVAVYYGGVLGPFLTVYYGGVLGPFVAVSCQLICKLKVGRLRNITCIKYQ